MRPRGWRTLLADDRRPLLRELGRELHAAAGAALDAGAQLRPGRRAARHRLAAARRPARGRPGRLRAAPPAARLARRLGARERASRSRSSRCATAATWSRSRPRRAARVKGIVHDASGSGQTLFIEPLVAVELGQRLARGAGRRGRGGRAHPRRAVGASSRPTPTRCARRSRRSPGSTCGPPRRRWRPRWTPAGAETTDRPEVDPAVGPPPGPERARRARSTSGSATATRRSS